MKFAAIVTSLFTLGALAEHKIRTTADERYSKAPLVNSDDCRRGCVFENEEDYWCFTTAPPALRIGWEWEQFYGETSQADPPVISYY